MYNTRRTLGTNRINYLTRIPFKTYTHRFTVFIQAVYARGEYINEQQGEVRYDAVEFRDDFFVLNSRLTCTVIYSAALTISIHIYHASTRNGYDTHAFIVINDSLRFFL